MSEEGLFHRAIVQSGSMLHAGMPEDAGRLAAAFLEELGLSKSQVDKLREVPVERLTLAVVAAMRKTAPPPGAAPDLRSTATNGGAHQQTSTRCRPRSRCATKRGFGAVQTTSHRRILGGG